MSGDKGTLAFVGFVRSSSHRDGFVDGLVSPFNDRGKNNGVHTCHSPR